jgi:hypothetical protein
MPRSNNLKSKLSQVLKEEIKALPDDLQAVLVDDMITAFESRYAVLNRAKSNLEFAINPGLEVLQ